MEHFYEQIEGWFDFEELYTEAVRRMPEQAKMVEVGVYKGRSCFFLAVEAVNSGKDIHICAVDRFNWPATAMRDFTAIRRLHKLEDRIQMFAVTSVEASRHFGDGSLDFVFLDADHTYEAVKADLAAWWPKVKPGGILAGHDWSKDFPGVAKAVTEWLPSASTSILLIPPQSWWVDKPRLA